MSQVIKLSLSYVTSDQAKTLTRVTKPLRTSNYILLPSKNAAWYTSSYPFHYFRACKEGLCAALSQTLHTHQSFIKWLPSKAELIYTWIVQSKSWIFIIQQFICLFELKNIIKYQFLKDLVVFTSSLLFYINSLFCQERLLVLDCRFLFLIVLEKVDCRGTISSTSN